MDFINIIVESQVTAVLVGFIPFIVMGTILSTTDKEIKKCSVFKY